MGKFRDMFKVRKPGHGDAVQKGFEKAARAKLDVTNKPKNPPDGGTKTSV